MKNALKHQLRPQNLLGKRVVFLPGRSWGNENKKLKGSENNAILSKVFSTGKTRNRSLTARIRIIGGLKSGCVYQNQST